MQEIPDAPSLTDEQRAIAEAPPAARLLVTAGAGSGKTHVLAARLAHLVNTEGLSPGDEVLVLSFSRAAVAELRRRVSALASDAGFVSASTFDSFATLLLATEQPERDLELLDYDARITAATDLIAAGDQPLDVLDLCRHVLIDEVQDLVGPRARLVLALLRRLSCGFTMFGDPAQSIYDYGAGEEVAATDVYDTLRTETGLAVTERTLERNFRARTPEARQVLVFGPQLRDSSHSPEKIANDLRTFLLGLPGLGDLTVAPRPLTRAPEHTKALLCRTNGQALLISRRLHELGVTHRLQRSASERAAAGWLAAAAGHLHLTKVPRTRMVDAIEQATGSSHDAATQRWLLLCRLDPRGHEEIDLRRVADRVRVGGLPEELNEVVETSVVVSTIHRAKGLEFDMVGIVDPVEIRDEDVPAENRVLYVALTRARSDLFRVGRPDTTGMYVDKPSRRWVRRGFGRHRRTTFAIEVCGDDIHGADPAGAWLIDTPVEDTQQYLRTQVVPGDAVTLELISATAAPAEHYRVMHNKRPIGITSEAFGLTLGRALGGGRRFPDRIERVNVESVDTVAGNEAEGRKHGLGPSGLWSRVRVNGLGELRYNSKEEQVTA